MEIVPTLYGDTNAYNKLNIIGIIHINRSIVKTNFFLDLNHLVTLASVNQPHPPLPDFSKWASLTIQ